MDLDVPSSSLRHGKEVRTNIPVAGRVLPKPRMFRVTDPRILATLLQNRPPLKADEECWAYHEVILHRDGLHTTGAPLPSEMILIRDDQDATVAKLRHLSRTASMKWDHRHSPDSRQAGRTCLSILEPAGCMARLRKPSSMRLSIGCLRSFSFRSSASPRAHRRSITRLRRSPYLPQDLPKMQQHYRYPIIRGIAEHRGVSRPCAASDETECTLSSRQQVVDAVSSGITRSPSAYTRA
ncbi:hypothetical protein V8E36_003650 [Tilletia maclaganii]